MNYKIKFFCRSFNKELYLLSRGLYAQAGYPCVRLTDQSADGYFFTMLRDQDCDIAINVDEDCFVTDLETVLELARRVADEGWVNAGISDAGAGCPRGGHPLVTNPFFNVFNLKLIRTKWNEPVSRKELTDFRFTEHSDELRQQFEKLDVPRIYFREKVNLDNADNEPYYNYFFWLALRFPGKTLYLNSWRHGDGITTVTDMCLHTWFARFYHPFVITYLFEHNPSGIKHEQRIDAIIDEAYGRRSVARPRFTPGSRMGFILDGMVRWSVKVPQRVMNWPNKWRKWL